MKSTTNFSAKIAELKEAIESADAMLIGAGAGLSTAAGMSYSGERFERFFPGFRERYGITDMHSGGFYPFQTLEEFWGYWSRNIWANRYEPGATQVYKDLLKVVKDKDYFVLTTNVDHQFQLAGFDKERLYYTQGDYGLFQCSVPCIAKTYDNKDVIYQMIEQQKDMRVPSELVPHCPRCGAPLTTNLRIDNTFVEDKGWYAAALRYENFLKKLNEKKVLLLELGVGANTPGIIKYPFWRMATTNDLATYACINYGEAHVPRRLEDKSIVINADIAMILQELLS